MHQLNFVACYCIKFTSFHTSVFYYLTHITIFQCNEVKGSTHMELEGLKRAINFLEGHLKITELVTDKHPSVKKFMRIQHADKKHLFDVWHVAKGKLYLNCTCKQDNFQLFNFH